MSIDIESTADHAAILTYWGVTTDTEPLALARFDCCDSFMCRCDTADKGD